MSGPGNDNIRTVFAKSGTKVLYTAVGSACKNDFDYVTRRFNASSARLNKPQGLDLR